jgi:hypothetical protein
MPLLLSTFTHLWNPIGFPAIWVVEGSIYAQGYAYNGRFGPSS